MFKWLAVAAVALCVGLLVVSALTSQGPDEAGFVRQVEKRVDLAKADSGIDLQWWQENQDLVLEEAWASCQWLEALPEFENPYQGPEEQFLEQQYLRESDMTAVLSGDRRFSNIVVEYAWAYLCIDTRNSRTSLPPGIEN
jgi:hypothetical protein